MISSASVWLDNLLRALVLLLAILSFIGWGFSGETGMVGFSSLVSTAALFAVALIPDSALRDRAFRITWATVVGLGIVAILYWIWTGYSGKGNSMDPPGLIFACVAGLGLMAGLARLRHSGEARPEDGTGISSC